MGNTTSTEEPESNASATLYYFAGRGRADQIRWLLAATQTTFIQKTISSRDKFLKLAERQLTFGQLPLLQIDGLELVQSQSICRYLAKRGNLIGNTIADEVKCDMIVDTVHDLLNLAYAAPFHRSISDDEGARHIQNMKDRWDVMGLRFEEILAANGGKHMVGTELTYADILIGHCVTWFVEECGPDCLLAMPLLVELQNTVISLPGIQSFIRGPLYYSIGDSKYVAQVSEVLGLPLPSAVNVTTANTSTTTTSPASTTSTPNKK